MREMDYVTHNTCLRCASLGLGCCSRCHPFILTEDLRLILKKHPKDRIRVIVEVNTIPTIYLHHLLDPEMKQIYYFWGGTYYRLQTKFINDSCTALLPGRGCILGNYRPLICKVWPFWWESGTDLSRDDFPIEINGDCTMATHWGMSLKEILREFGCSESSIRKDLLALNRSIKEHGEILREASKRKVPPEKLLDYILDSI